MFLAIAPSEINRYVRLDWCWGLRRRLLLCPVLPPLLSLYVEYFVCVPLVHLCLTVALLLIASDWSAQVTPKEVVGALKQLKADGHILYNESTQTVVVRGT